MTPDANTGIERTIGQRLHKLANTLSAAYFRRSEAAYGITLSEWRVLRGVIDHPNVSQGEIAEAEGLNPMSVSRAAAGLRRKGLITVAPDADDRRRTALSATHLGRDLGHEMAAREHAVYHHLLAVLLPAEVEALDELLQRVTESLKALDDLDPSPVSRDWPALITEHQGT